MGSRSRDQWEGACSQGMEAPGAKGDTLLQHGALNVARETGGGRLTHPAVRREKAVPTPADMVRRGGDPSEPPLQRLTGNTGKMKESRDPSQKRERCGCSPWFNRVRVSTG